jgi:dolichol-phosphate mannosyltransferase
MGVLRRRAGVGRGEPSAGREPSLRQTKRGESAAVPSVWLVLPTFNEADNLEAIVRATLPRLEAGTPEHRVLIVDDASPDGTGEIADRLAAELDPVDVIHRDEKDGLGRAYLTGFAHALRAGADLVLEMDADFSHDPADLPRLIVAAEDADLVVGSRYVPGGEIVNWGIVRRLLSFGGSLYARTLLGVPVRDLTGGFKCFRREILERLDLADVHADGYGFQIELTYRALVAGFHVREIPIVFHERRAGTSKMTTRIALEALWKVPALRLRCGLRGRARAASRATA